jgi:glycosyltransferase involved in cell wall biosynthesis
MRVAIDGTPAAIQTAGVGRYTRELVKALVSASVDDEFQILCVCNSRAARDLEFALPPGTVRDIRRLALPYRVTTALWQRINAPLPVDLFLEDYDVFHGPDFVLPPVRQAAVVTVHDLSYLIAPQSGAPSLVAFLKQAVPRAIRRADQVITVSASVAAELVDAYPFARDKVRAIPNGVEWLNCTQETRKSASRPVILTVGTVEPRKNHLHLLDAMQFVWQEYPDAELVIAGRIGWMADEITAKIRQSEACSNVRFVEGPDDATLADLYEEANLFVYPSLYEGFGLPVLEAMARGIPVVASDIASLRETGGNAARYADPNDPEQLGSVITNVLSNTSMQSAMVSNGSKRVKSHSWAETARRTRSAYAAAIERRAR